MSKKILIEGLEQGPPQKFFGDWSFKRLRRNVNAAQIKVVRDQDRSEGPVPDAPTK